MKSVASKSDVMVVVLVIVVPLQNTWLVPCYEYRNTSRTSDVLQVSVNSTF